jgi:tetratricopeptide (TPR) repeat protein
MTAGHANTGRAALLAQLDRLISTRQFAAAEAACAGALTSAPEDTDVWLRLANACQQMANYEGMKSAAQRAQASTPTRVDAGLVMASALAHCSEIAEARALLSRLQEIAQGDRIALRHIADSWVHLNGFRQAEQCLSRVRDMAPEDPDVLYALSSARVALGDLDDAETLLDTLIAKRRYDFDALYNRSTLRRQTRTRNHVAELETILASRLPHPGAEVPVRYALSKEMEDLGEHEAAFRHLDIGARVRRQQMSYRVSADVETMSALAGAFPRQPDLTSPQVSATGGPIFVVGLPRSGTTLVDRILSAHSSVASLGELNDLALAVTRLNYPAASKAELIAKSGRMDFGRLGDAYRRAIGGYGAGKPWLVDKTPANFLYLGLIARAMPEARIIHLRRHPMASGHAMYKTLFRMGYPFSYSLDDLGAYIAAYLRLMHHWRRAMPNRFLDVDYEELVADQEVVSRRIMEHCGLAWEPACLDFHQNDSPSATASAAQVRRPMYRDSLELWRSHEAALQPLVRALAREGVNVDVRKGGT